MQPPCPSATAENRDDEAAAAPPRLSNMRFVDRGAAYAASRPVALPDDGAAAFLGMNFWWPAFTSAFVR